VQSSGSEVLSYPILHCGREYLGHKIDNFIIVCVDYSCDPTTIGASQFAPGTWIKILDRNVNDCQVPGCTVDPFGVVVAHFSTFPKKKNVTKASVCLVEETFYSAGLRRCRTSHEGRFYMCGVRSTSMSSESMVQVSSPSQHHHFDENKMNTSLINYCQPILNDLSWQALSVRDNCGQIQCGILKSALWAHNKTILSSNGISPHIIFTMWKIDPSSQLNIPFSNTEHIDGDDCGVETSKIVFNYIKQCDNIIIQQYVEKMGEMYPLRSQYNKQSQQRYHILSTCVWVHIESNQEDKSVQYLVFSEAGCCCNLSSGMPNAVTSTFLGGIVGHVTSRSYWIIRPE